MSLPTTPSKTANTGKPRDAPKPVDQSPQNRINDILESARARRLNMDDENSSSAPASPQAGLLRSAPERGDVESSADEETHIFRARSNNNINYQSTQNRTTARQQPSKASIRRLGRTLEPGTQDNVEREEEEGHESWWTRLVSEYGSIELENKGSVARDHLALERTFLAWLRTSLAFASIGIAITQLFRLNTTSENTGGSDSYRRLRQMGKPLGATFLGISIVLLFVGFRRYFSGQHWIIRGKFPASRGSIALVAGITCALVITSLVVVVVVEPGAYEN